jgi:hypothetical protein
MISGILYFFSPNELIELRGTKPGNNLEELNWILREGETQRFGILPDNTDKKLYFIHLCFS